MGWDNSELINTANRISSTGNHYCFHHRPSLECLGYAPLVWLILAADQPSNHSRRLCYVTQISASFLRAQDVTSGTRGVLEPASNLNPCIVSAHRRGN